jgi:ribosomal-protein-alanine N-acetyltransferase
MGRAGAMGAGGAISVRRADLDDLDPIMAIEEASFAAPWPRDAMADEIAKHEWSTVLVAEADGGIVGFAVAWSVADERHLQNIATAPACRGRGVGDALLRHVVDEAKGGGAQFVILEVRASNEAAKRLYAAYDFRPIGIRQGYYQDNGEDAIVMVLALKEGEGW